MSGSIGKFRIIKTLPLFLGHGPADVISQIVQFDSGNLKISGWLYKPTDQADKKSTHSLDTKAIPGAAVICGHGGVGGIPAHYDVVFRRLAKAGWTVAAPSYRGEGGSDGEIEFAHGEVDDTLACMKAVGELPVVDPENIWLLGSSHGAMVSLLAAAKIFDTINTGGRYYKIKGVVSISGIYDICKWLDGVRKTDHLLMSDPFVRSLMKLNDQELQTRSAINVAGNIGIPVLLVHGESDMIVPHEQSIIMADALKSSGNNSCKLHIEPGSDHEFVWGPEREHARNTWAEIAKFIDQTTR
ncbi:MAG: alpha/beta fold hydrolase [bacterium]|nr:alpha/beta fold hydrolase [bacterium]